MIRLFALFLLGLTVFGQQAFPGQPQAPRRAPALTIGRVGAPEMKLSAYRGKVVALAFLNTGCSHCQHFAQQLAVYQRDYAAKGVQVIAVVFDNDAKAGYAKFRDNYVKGYPLGYSDETTVMNWLGQPIEQGYFVPILVLIDRKGMIEGQYMGDDNLFQDPDGNIRKKLDRLVKQP